MANVAALERRIAKMARAAAKLVIELRHSGDHAGAGRLEALAMDVATQMRKDAR